MAKYETLNPKFKIRNPKSEILPVLLGPTASGKTKLAVQLAAELDGEIISADSRQVYRDMNIGTGKDLNDYVLHGKAIPYHLINIAGAGERYHVFAYQNDCLKVMADIRSRNKQPILCGGTGLYIDAVLRDFSYTQVPVDEGLRQELEKLEGLELLEMFKSIDSPYRDKADLSTKKRVIRAIEISRYLEENAIELQPKLPPNITFGLNPPPEERRKRITKRLHERLEEGLVEEVENLVKNGLSYADLNYYGLEYKFVSRFLQGEMSYDKMVFHLNIAIHQFAKRQMTYFRKMEKDGLKIHWLDDEWPLLKKVTVVKDVLITAGLLP